MLWKGFIFWAILVLVAFVRVFFAFSREPPSFGACLKQQIQGEGTVSADPVRSETGQMVVVHAYRLVSGDTDCFAISALGQFGRDIRIKTGHFPSLAYGHRVTFQGNLSPPYNFSGDNGRSFDYIHYLAKDGIFSEIKSARVSIMSSSSLPSFDIKDLLFRTKRNFVSNLEKTLGEPHAALAAGLVVGEKSALGKDLLQDFRSAGLIHIVVLSGFNITIVADAVRRLLSRLPRVLGILLGSAGIILFGILVGGGATVVRSCLMAGIALSADLIRRDYNVMRALVFAGLLMIIQSPLILFYDPSFQLSFLATLGLILLASPVESKLQFVTKRLGLRGILSATLATQIFVSPYLIYMMGQLSIVAMITNILVLPIVPLTMLLVFLTGLTGFLYPLLSQLFAWSSHILLAYELLIVRVFSDLPYAAINLPAISLWLVVAFYATFFTARYWLRSRSFSQSRTNSD